MSKFNHNFRLFEKGDSYRIYESGDNKARIDFISGSCVRVALYKDESQLLPTFCVNPDNRFLIKGRSRLDTSGFSLCTPESESTEAGEHFLLPCGIDMEVDFHNFILKYTLNGKEIFSDRKPLSYNLAGEFGRESFHYITRQAGERIFGLGDKTGELNKAGKAYRIETTDCMGYDAAESDPLYKHIPFYICENSTGSYGIFYDTSDTSYVDLGKEINNYYPAYKYFKTEDNCLVYYVFFGTKLSVLQQFASLCGKQPLAPKWSFDYCGSTMAYTDAPDSDRQMDGFLNRLKTENLSCKGFYLSSGYTSVGEKRCVFNWNKEKFPDPKSFIEKFSEAGIRIIPNIKPAFLDSHPLYGEIAEKGLFIKNPDGTPFVTEFWDGLGSYLDFTNPEAFDFWSGKVKETLLDLGITATWNDNNEFDIRDLDAVAKGFADGEVPASSIRPVLTYLMVAASYKAQIESNPELRPFLSTRSGNIAVRRLAQTWSGDNKTSFKDLKYCHNIGLTMSMSGLFFYGHDLGGFHGQMPSRQLLLRWLQHGIFEPRFTIHSWNEDGSATMPWSYPDIMDSVRLLFAQRKRLLPYLYSCAYDAVENEIPMNAPPLLYYDDEELYKPSSSMMLGKDILVGFVLEEDSENTSVYLPKGESWYLGEKLYKGGQTVNVHIPAEKQVPYFVRSGCVLPTDEAPYGFDCGEEIVFTVYPKEKGKFESFFFDDDGESFAYKENNCVKLHFSVICSENSVSVEYENTGKMPLDVQIRLCGGDERPLEVRKK
ncbi:MAG: TIM-barrel domain-containing protein [Acutalibacteraceae bacterium]